MRSVVASTVHAGESVPHDVSASVTPAMGQPVAVVEKPSTSPGVVRFEPNRTLTGMGHERFASAGDAFGPRPSAELARRLFATGQVARRAHLRQHHHGRVWPRAHDSSGLGDVVRDLYQYWRPGMEPPAFDDRRPRRSRGDAAAGSAQPPAVMAAVTPSSRRRPSGCRPDLLERSRLARERWKAKQG